MQHDTTSSSSSINTGEKESPSSSHIRSAVSDIINQQPYSTIFFHSGGSLANSPAKTGSIPVSAGGNNTNTTIDTATAAADGLSKLMSDHRTLLNQHALCLLKLQKTFKEAETLRQENTNLRMASHDLTNQLNLLIQADLHQTPSFRDNWCGQTLPLSERLDGLSMNEKRRESGEDFSSESPTSVIENDRADVHNVEAGRVTLPKSISVRSNEFLKMSHGAHSGPSASNPSLDGGVSRTRTRTPSPVSGPQKVYVRGGSRKDGPIEMEVYNQGMYKTELCNKWQETGTCPYNDHCQFAHGIGELRPVIRHPRYKTEVCRMVLAGDPCPYGHRCHFRHALTEQEKLMVPLRMD